MQVDGQLKTGRDVIIAALLGAEEFGFATAPLVVSGCIMMRVCHLDTCPVGVATQNPELRKRFTGKPEFVVNFFEFIAEEVREHLAALGLPHARRGHRPRRAARHRARPSTTGRPPGLDLAPILHVPELPRRAPLHRVDRAGPRPGQGARQHADPAAPRARSRTAQPVRLELPIRNVNRTVGTMLGYEVTRRYGGEGLPDDTIDDRASPARPGRASARSCPAGITLRLERRRQRLRRQGPVRRPAHRRARPTGRRSWPRSNIIAGNVILYGATAGEVFLRGVVGERFCVRNSGATAVVEGVGDHGCEYMTGGRVVVLGPTGRNFARRHVRRRRLRARPRRRSTAGQPRDGRPRPARRRRRGVALRDGRRRATRPRPARRWPSGCSPTGTAASAAFAKVMPQDYKRVLAAASAAEPRAGTSTRPSWPRPTRSWTARREIMADPTGFLKHRREMPTRRPVDVRIRDWREVYEPFPSEQLPSARRRAAWTAASRSATTAARSATSSPSGTTSSTATTGATAIDRLHATNNFPEFTGRLCPAPCEAACVLGINADPVTIKQVEVEIIDRACAEGWVAAGAADRRRPGKKVAVVGSGPAGLAAAQQLTRAGHDVSVFERADRIGGLLRYGIPEFKMEKRHLDRRLDQMRAEGTEFRAGVNVGVDVTAAELRAEFDAVVLAGGATRGARPADPGPRARRASTRRWSTCRWPTGCRRATSTARRSAPQGKHVVIIGGGDTGADCLGTAHRQGAASVTQLEIMPRPPDDAARRHAVADLADDVPGRLAPTRRAASGSTRSTPSGSSATTTARCGRCALTRSSWSTTAGSPRSRAPSARSRASWCCWPWASPAPEPDGLLDRARRRARRARQRRPRRRRTRPTVAGRVRRRRHGPRPVADRLGDRRGPRRRRRGGRPVPDAARPTALPGGDPADRAAAGRPVRSDSPRQATASAGLWIGRRRPVGEPL